jgi:hypothetical protein
MATPKSAPKTTQAATQATDNSSPSPARESGRRLTLKFTGAEVPILGKISFIPKTGDDAKSWDQNDPKTRVGWTEVPKALSIFFIKYLAWAKAGNTEGFYFQGRHKESLAASLGDAISNGKQLGELFEESVADGKFLSRLRLVFPYGQNLHGKDKDKKDRRIFVSPNYLPPDCVEIFWDVRGNSPLTEVADFALLEKRIRESAGIPDAPVAPKGEASVPAEEAAPKKAEPEQKKQTPKKPSKSTATTATGLETEGEEESEAPSPEWTPPEFVPPPIDQKLFSVQPTTETWPDDLPVVNFGEGLDWTLRNAFEGVLILGATGSGKTSGSGATIAEAFLHAGFGGLVLTVKTDEAEHWQKMCARCGREKDLVIVRPGGDWRLNLLAYEAQRPGAGGGLSKNLVAFCRNLLAIASRSQGGGVNEQFWQSATDQLLNATFDLFLLAGGAITFDRLANFIAAAPTENLPATEAGWLRIPVFGEVLKKAKENADEAEDLRIFKRTTDYWCKIYPGLSSKTRTSITLGVYAMLDAFRGRDIPDLISSDTNITPESIISEGKIVVLDLPIKEYGQTGLLVQSAWKYICQMALERQAKARNPHRRPTVIWEDEGQQFFSDHDHLFQATARSARVCRVILSQNLPTFYSEFGGNDGATVNSVFGNLNTKIFHANNDVQTNEWSSKQFGSELRRRRSTTQNPPQARGFFDAFSQTINPTGNTSFSHAENWEPAVRPEEFNKLRNGGEGNNFEVDAYITWPQLDDGQGRHFILTTFLQNTQP